MSAKSIIKLLSALSLVVSSAFISLAPLNAYAGTSTANAKATATLAGTCAISATNANFGTITPGQASSTTTATLSVQCTKNTAYGMTMLWHAWGTSCGWMTGATHGDHILYSQTFPGKTVAAANTQADLGNTNSQPETGTGAMQNWTFNFAIQPSTTNWAAVCPGYTVNNAGYNPYVTPDNYSDTNSFQVTF